MFMKKIIKIVSNCFTCVLITLLLLLLFVNFCKRDEGYFRVGRYSLFDVNGNSMYPEINNGDLIAVDMKDREKYEIGDIVSFISEKNDY